MRLSSVSKSADIQAISKVVDENEVLFQDISLLVKAPYFILPQETPVIEIELHIIACAERKTIAFAPTPDALAKAEYDAIEAVRSGLYMFLKTDGDSICGRPEFKAS